MRLMLVLVVTALAAVGLMPRQLCAAWADKLELSGYLESDNRFQLDEWRGPAGGPGYRFEMNRNDLDLRLEAFPVEQVRAVAEARFRFFGFNQAGGLRELVDREAIDPYAFMLDEAYLHLKGFLWNGLDLKIGRMVQNWGAVDQFNPTDNLSSRDLSDPLDFSRKVPNQMVQLDLFPADWLSLSFVWVPVFKPAQLPPSTVMAFAIEDLGGGDLYVPAPPLKPSYVRDLMDLFADDSSPLAQMLSGGVNFLPPPMPAVMPETSIANSQAGARASFRAGEVDFSLSYYYGRNGFPVAVTGVADVLLFAKGDQPPDGVATSRTDPRLKPEAANVNYVIEVMYPRMHVAGFDFAYSADWLGGMGIRGEAAVIFPEKVTFGLRGFLNGDDIDGLGLLPFPLAASRVNVAGDPFIKVTIGLDGNPTPWLYLNAMYVRGFFDEFDDMYGLHNYVVGAAEVSLFDGELAIRTASVFDCNDYSATLYPEITWTVVPSVQLKTGIFWYFGQTIPEGADRYDYAAKSRFGQKAAGRNIAFLKAKVNW